ncbi:MAG: SMP-30/gluconolactonase/LRE family protein [Melioribacteraceae bacterium]|nr:SMP-30/gluconolactonase/LRE family protein [Melioribacteraceae bacterium]
MTRIFIIVSLVVLFFGFDAQSNYKLEKLADGFTFVEGPVWVDGKLLFSDIPENTIYAWTEDTGTEVYYKPSGNSNGLALDAEGNLILAQHGKRRVAKLTKDKDEILLVDNYNGKPFNSPNDLTVDSRGSIYFTDPPYGISKEQEELGFYGIYKFTSEGDLYLLDSTLIRPNGIILSPDEDKLIVSDSQEKTLFIWDIVNDSTITNKSILVEMDKSLEGTTDGMKLGRDGLIYSTGPGGIWIINLDGEVIEKIDVPGQTTNCNWGPNGEVLYITSGDAVYSLDAKLRIIDQLGIPGSLLSKLSCLKKLRGC